MSAPLQAKLGEAARIMDKRGLPDLRDAIVEAADIAAALRPPEGEVGALCERIEGWVSGGLPLHAEDVRAALAHLRRFAAVEAALREIEALANDHRDGWLETRHTDDGDQYRLAIDEGLKWEAIGALARALAPAPAAEPAP